MKRKGKYKTQITKCYLIDITDYDGYTLIDDFCFGTYREAKQQAEALKGCVEELPSGWGWQIKFQASQKLRDMCEAYKAFLRNKEVSADEMDEIIDIIVTLETALANLKEDNE